MHRSRRHVLVVLVTLSVVLGLVVPGAVAQPADCGRVMRLSQLQAALDRGPVRGTGLTVVTGTEPRQFDVEVFGILDDGLGVGRDMIMVEVSADFIDAAGGIWQGMSGSPVYVDGALVGAVAFGLSFVSTNIGGLTPAENLVQLVGLPDGTPTFAAAGADGGAEDEPPGRDIPVDDAVAAEIRARLGEDGSTRRGQQQVSFRQLSVPLSVSGLSPSRLDVVSRAATEAGMQVTTTPGARAQLAQAGTSAAPVPGGNLAVADSYGDLSLSAVGTTTLVCDGKVVGFGHPFQFAGETLSGASSATSLGIIPDPGFAPFKLANVGGPFGTIDQDRFAGIRGRIGDIPDTTPITSRVDDLDGGSRRGRTDVVRPQALPDIAAFHLLGNIDTVIDRIGKGSSSLTMRVSGSGSDSGAFTLVRDNVFASTFDIAFDSIFESLGQLSQLRDFRGEDVTIDAVHFDAAVRTAVEAYAFDEVRVGVDGAEPVPSQGQELLVVPGSTVLLQVDLVGVEDDATLTVEIPVTIPEDVAGFGFLDLTAGNPFGQFFGEECFFFPGACGPASDAETVQELADELAEAPTNDTITATLFLEQAFPGEPVPGGPAGEQPATEVPAEPGGPEPIPTPAPSPEPIPASGGSGQASARRTAGADPGAGGDASATGAHGPSYAQAVPEPVRTTVTVDRAVQGFFGVPIVIDNGQCPDCGPLFSRVGGSDRVGTSVALADYVFGGTDTVVIAPAGEYPYALVAAPLAAQRFGPVLLAGEAGLAPEAADAIRRLGATSAVVVAPDDLLVGIAEDLTAAGIRDIDRIGGADRYEVSAAVAGAVAAAAPPESAGRAWLVEGEHPDPSRGWPDAMSAGPLAAFEQVPILLTRSGDLPDATGAAIDGLGLTAVTVAGGPSAVGQPVLDAVAARGVAVEQIGGATRYETSLLLARRAIELGAFPQNLWLVTGRAFPDGLAAAPVVAATAGVMLMVDGQDLAGSPPARELLAELAFSNPLVTVVGLEAAISSGVEQQVFDILVGADSPGGPGAPPAPASPPPPPGGAG